MAWYIREATQKITKNEGNIKQLIVLTHNTQFHNEASYWPNYKEKHYYRLIKEDDGNTRILYDNTKNKVNGAYFLLWQSVVDAARESDSDAPVTCAGIENNVRRIIEGYFKIIGGKPGAKVTNVLENEDLSVPERRVIESFNIWTNAGSHIIADDIDQTAEISSTKTFLRLFRLYFKLADQLPHFNMMVKACNGEKLLGHKQIFSDDFEA